ncbi:hypothetical protein ACIOWF_06655 [Cellulosimicrobium cellulans]|uniref:hypothetical protein n=1 Tax=Cellulosimicrobium cellulans TaxID=1710 RepID=UPI00380EDF91
MSNDATVTPADLARDLRVTPKRVRDILRAKYGTLPDGESRWHLADEQVEHVRSVVGHG